MANAARAEAFDGAAALFSGSGCLGRERASRSGSGSRSGRGAAVAEFMGKVLNTACLTAVAVLAAASTASAAGDPFTVGAFPVEAKAANAVTAKKAAIAEGQRAALRSLFKRLVPVTSYSRLRQAPAINAAEYVSGIAVRGEQNSSTEYYASLDFRFSPEAVRNYLNEHGVPYVDRQAPPLTLVPVATSVDGVPVRAPTRDWLQVWRSLDLANSVAPVTVAAPRPSLQLETLHALADGDAAKGLRVVAGEYGVQRIVVAQAAIDSGEQKIRVRVSGRDGVGAINWETGYRIFDGDTAYAMELAAVVTLGVLEGRWKAVNGQSSRMAAFPMPAAALRLDILFSGADEWYRTQSEISALPGVAEFRVEALAGRSASVSLKYPGGGSDFARAVARKGYALIDAGDRWVLQRR